MFEKYKKNILIVIGLSVVFYAILLLYNDFDIILNSPKIFTASTLMMVLLLVIISLILKFLRWHKYLSYLSIRINLGDSILIFCAGLTMSISPGKVGELIKAFLIRKKYNIPISKISAIVFAERLLEFVSLVIIFAVGILFYYQQIIHILLIVLLMLIIMSAIVKSNNFRLNVKKILEKFSITKGLVDDVAEFNRYFAELVRPRIFIIALALSLLAWIFEILSFGSLIFALDSEISYLFSIFSYSAAMVTGAVSMIPGGLLGAELSLIYLLEDIGVSNENSIFITLVIRFATLWFSVLIGIISYLLFVKKTKYNKDVL